MTGTPRTFRLPERVAYVVSHSYPYSSNGYAVRTHEVARALIRRGHEVIVFNRPGRPWDIEGFSPTQSVPTEQVIDGVRYIFLPTPAAPDAARRERLRAAENVLVDAFEVFRPGMVLGVSNWENAEPAQNAARRFGCAFFYEQRGFWEMPRTDGAAEAETTPAEREAAQLNAQNDVRIARGARAVFTLNAAMRREMVARGVPAEQIHLVPNGVAQAGVAAKGVTRSALGITARYLLSYIGSLSEYEGVEDLLHLTAKLRGQGRDVAAMIVGSSAPKGLIGTGRADPAEQALRALADGLGIAEHVRFVPQVPWDQTGAYYNMSNAVILPRRRSPMTELVAPIKPYAAATYGVPVYMTDMPPLDEVARDIHATLFPAGDIDALAGLLDPVFDGTHPAIMESVPAAVLWPRRVRPMSDLLAAEARDVTRLMAQSLPAGGGGAGMQTTGSRFDLDTLPQVALAAPAAAGTLVCIGPCAGLAADPDTAARMLRVNRAGLLGALGRELPGRFVIDWAGLHAQPDPEWAGLWSIENMRLNRQLLDAVRIALDRGWQVQVLGPVHRSHAPLFRTVAQVIEEVLPSAPETPATADTPDTAQKAAP